MALTKVEPDVINIPSLTLALAQDVTDGGINDIKATLASPHLTGVPTAPTASSGTSTTQLATTAFVTTATNLKASLASPAFTGVPTAPTASSGTSTTQLATTAFVTTFQAGILYNVVVLTSTTSWIVPAGVTKIKVTLIGGGGGSAAEEFSSSIASNGGTTYFGNYVNATGGTGGKIIVVQPLRDVIYTEGTSGVGVGGNVNLSPPNNGGGILGGYGSSGRAMKLPINSDCGGGSGGIAIKTISGLVPGATIVCTIGGGGQGSVGVSYTGIHGNSGAICIEY